jgi:hypothetical protein
MSVDNYFTRQYIPEDNSEHHTRRRENLKSHIEKLFVTDNVRAYVYSYYHNTGYTYFRWSIFSGNEKQTCFDAVRRAWKKSTIFSILSTLSYTWRNEQAWLDWARCNLRQAEDGSTHPQTPKNVEVNRKKHLIWSKSDNKAYHILFVGINNLSRTYFMYNDTVFMRFQVLTAASMMFRVVFWVILPCKIIVDRRFRRQFWTSHCICQYVIFFNHNSSSINTTNYEAPHCATSSIILLLHPS